MRLESVLARQHGVISRAHAVGCGLSVRTVRRRAPAGPTEWVEPWRSSSRPPPEPTRRWKRRLITILRRAGLTGFVARHPFGDTWIDIAFPDESVAVEIDSWAWHTDPSRFAADRDKGNAHVLAGWTLLRFTSQDVTHRPGQVVARIRAALGR